MGSACTLRAMGCVDSRVLWRTLSLVDDWSADHHVYLLRAWSSAPYVLECNDGSIDCKHSKICMYLYHPKSPFPTFCPQTYKHKGCSAPSPAPPPRPCWRWPQAPGCC